MFYEIERSSEQWIEKRETSLYDVSLLLRDVDRDCAHMLDAVISSLCALNLSDRARMLKNPATQRALGDLTDAVLSLYDHVDEPNAAGAEMPRVREAVGALTTVVAFDSELAILPAVDWIRIVIGEAAKYFNSGSEYGIEIDRDIDVSCWETDTKGALEMIALSPSSDVLVRTFVSYIVPLKQREEVKNLSFSSRELPNVVFKNNEASPIRFGETLVHEADHQFFYALEEIYSFWITEPRSQAAAHFSPWRDDSRPLDGILRGLSAFTRVALYYAGLIGSGVDQVADSIGPLLMQRVVECEAAANTLAHSGELSVSGATYLRELIAALKQADESARHCQDYSRWKIIAEKALNAHREKCGRSCISALNEFTHDHL